VQGVGTIYIRALNLFECKADICVMQIEDTQPARQTPGDAVPTVFPPTFSGGVGRARSGHLPIPEPYRESQSIGPLAAKRRSQSLLKMDRSGAVCVLCICSNACLWYNPSCSGHVTWTRVYLRLLISSSISSQKAPQLTSLLSSYPKDEELILSSVSWLKEPNLIFSCLFLSSKSQRICL